MNRKEILKTIRIEMKENKIEAYIITLSDPHKSEYLPEHWKILEWVSGFTGSAGTLCITQREAGLWTDSRYFIQANKELEKTDIKLYKMGTEQTPSLIEWIGFNINKDDTVGLDGRLFSVEEIESFREKDIKVDLEQRLVDNIWIERPPLPKKEIEIYAEKYSGESSISKINRIRVEMRKKKTNCYIINTLDDIAWTLNLRGRDILYTPVFISYLIILERKVILFIDKDKVSGKLGIELKNVGIEIKSYIEMENFISVMEEKTILLDKRSITISILNGVIEKNKIVYFKNIIEEMKAIKNDVEIRNHSNAQLKDNVALIKFLYWLVYNIGRENIDELKVVKKIEKYRMKQTNYVEPSFSTIAGYREHGAIVHYSVTQESSKQLKENGMLLIDTGGQYLEGTTDITRTISLGELTNEERRNYTLVLKGHINLISASFKKGTTGSELDVLAKLPLWSEDKDYGHGTGHGIGHYLSVHEGPQAISPTNKTVLQEGMLITIEPGYYEEGDHGIRLENIVTIISKNEDDYEFKLMSYCMFDLNAVELKLLNNKEKSWLNNYHKEVYKINSPYLNTEEKVWLKHATREI